MEKVVISFILIYFCPIGKSEKKIKWNEWDLWFETYIFTKLLKTVCLINTNSLICRFRQAICNCKLWKAFWFYWSFFVWNIYVPSTQPTFLCLCRALNERFCVWWNISSLNNHGLYVRVINTHISVCRHARYDCMLWNSHWYCCVFREFPHIIEDNSSCFETLNYHQTFRNCMYGNTIEACHPIVCM